MKCPKCQLDNTSDSKFCKECGTQLHLGEEIQFSKTITLETPLRVLVKGGIFAGKYKILGEIGRGGMGIVLKAEDTKLKRTVALKFLPPELSRYPEAKERFIREAQAAAALDHPHICTIHEAEEYEGQAYIAMAYVDGQSLKERIAKSPLDTEEAVEIAAQVAEGLAEAHKKGIIHRDIKPGNIMVTEKGQAKIMDFGLAKVRGESLITKEAKTMGTVAYMSPEQAKGEVVDHRTDIWSLGVVMYEMLSGQLPFGGENEGSLLYSIVHKPAQPLRKADPAIPAEIERVVLKALEKNLADRYQSMGELLEDLKALAEGLKPIRAKVQLFRGRILGIRKPVFFAVVAALAATLVFVVLTVLIPTVGTDVLDSIAILPLVNASGDPAQDHLAFGLTETLISELYKVKSLQVTSRQAVMPYKDSDKPPKKIAQELNVKALVEASFLRSGDRIRLTARLIDPVRNRIVWDGTVDREYSDILFLQSELCRTIVDEIKVAVTPAEQTLLAQARKVNPQAYELFLQGFSLFLSREEYEEGGREAIGFFEKAIAADPTLASAYAWLGFTYWDLGANFCIPEKEANSKAGPAIRKALELDESQAFAHSILAFIKLSQDWDFAGAEKDLDRALELQPGNPDVQWIYGVYLGQVAGRLDEAVATLERLRSEPAYQKNVPFKTAQFYMCAGRIDEALKFAEEAAAYPELFGGIGILTLAEAYAMKGLFAEAIALIDNVMPVIEAQNDFVGRSDAARLLALAGRREQAQEIMENVQAYWAQKNIDNSFRMASFYAALGDKDKAFQYLEKGYKARSGALAFLKYSWTFHSLHGDPRFEELARKIGFPAIPGLKKD